MAVAVELSALGRCWFWLLVGLQAVSVYGTQLSSEACRELGFSSNLLCSSCNLLGQFNLNQLDPFCRQCCQEEAQLETRKLYAGAVLELRNGRAPSKSVRGTRSFILELMQYATTLDPLTSGFWNILPYLRMMMEAFLSNVTLEALTIPCHDRIMDSSGVILRDSRDSHHQKTFVRSDKPKLFRGLQIKYVRGSDPVLKLLDDSGNIAEELSILKWNTDSVEEFLSEKLERL